MLAYRRSTVIRNVVSLRPKEKEELHNIATTIALRLEI